MINSAVACGERAVSRVRPAGTMSRKLSRSRFRPYGKSQRISAFTLRCECLESRHLLSANVIITEFMASNQGTLDDGDGNSSDWVEIHNAGDAAIDLSGYRLTDAPDDLSKWTFPTVVMEPSDYLVIFASGQDTDNYVDAGGNLHTNFRLSAGGEYLGLVAPDGSVVSEYGSGTIAYPAQRGDTSYGLAQTVTVVSGESDAYYQIPLANIGLDWTMPGFDAAAAGFQAGKAAIGFEDRPENRTNFVGAFTTELPSKSHAVLSRIEFDLSNASAISSMDLRMMYDNGFAAYINGELVHAENAPEVLGWFSTAQTNSPRDSRALELSSFAVSEHVDKLVDGQNVLAIHGLNFATDNSDLLFVPQLVLGTVDMPAAFGEPKRVGFMTTPTPGSANIPAEEISDGFVGDLEMSVASGYYDQPFQVELTHNTPAATVYYTTDSSRPTETNGTVYSDPITISGSTVLRAAAIRPDFIPGSIESTTYIFLDDVLRQDGDGLPDTWGTLGSGCNNTQSRNPAPANYDMDRRVVNDRRYRDTIRDDLQSIPIMTLVVDPEDLWSEESGIYSNPLSEGIQWERPVSVELLNLDGEIEFDVDAGIRIHGGWGRCPSQSNKHSFRLLFRNQYGDSKLRYPMFGEDATDTFDTFVLRGNFNHTWATGDGTNTTFVNDQFAAQTQLEMGYVSPHGYYVHLYLNGLYWGIYNPMERPSAPFAADYFGGNKDDYDVLVVGTPTDGNSQAWTQLTRAASRGDYETVQDMLDVDAAIDYFIVNQYGGNWDWPQNNWYASRNREVEGAKWYFHSWDAEGMFGQGLAVNRVRETGGALGGLIGSLRRIEEFQIRYADRIQKHFFNDGLLTPGANIDRLNRLTAPIDRAVVGESARWGDGSGNSGRARTRDDNWLPALERLRENYFPQRGDRVLDQFRAVDLWPDTQAPQLNRHGGPVQEGFVLTISNPQTTGRIYHSLDGTDPRVAGGDVAPGAIVYDGSPITVNEDLKIMARVLNDDGEWSPLTEADFLVTGLRITEVNYHPHDPNPIPGMGEADVDSSQFEYIELVNVGSESVDLTGVNFARGITFEFPQNMALAPGEHTVVVQNTEAFESRYEPGLNIAGEFSGDLSDFGDLIELRDSSDVTIVRFSYLVSGVWPTRANGQGSSLEMVDPFGSYQDATNWRGSSEFGGSPGTAGLGPRFDVVINEVVGHGESAEVDMLELHNTASSDIDINNWYIGDPSEDPFRLRITSPTTIAANGYHVLTEADLGFSFRIDQGDNITLIEADASGRPLRFVDQAQFDPAAPGISIGAWPDRHGTWLPLSENTLGGPNAGLRVGDVIVSEVNFHPADLDGNGGQRQDNFEYVELYNTTGETVDISGWRLSGAVSFTFDDATTIDANGALLLVRVSPTSSTANVLRFIYGIGRTVPMAGRYRGSLDDESGSIRLEQPSDPNADPDQTPYIYVDEMAYGTRPPFPAGANMTGQTFTRLSPAAFGNSPASWIVTAASPGAFEFVERVVGDSNEDGLFNQLDIVAVLSGGKYNTGQPATWTQGDWNGDGLFNQVDIVTALQSGSYAAAAAAANGLSKSDVEAHDLLYAELMEAEDLLFGKLSF